MHEEWRPIDGFDRYEVSAFGGVRNLGGQVVRCGPGVRVVKAGLLKPFVVLSTGYMQVLLPDRKKHFVRRLVAVAFHGAPPLGRVVNHKNAIRSDNRAENLEWVAQSENLRQPCRVHGKVGWAKGLLGAAAPKVTPIVGTNLTTGEQRAFACASDAVREFGFDSGGITRCCQGKWQSHRGWAFRFSDGCLGFPQRTSLGRDMPDEVCAPVRAKQAEGVAA